MRVAIDARMLGPKLQGVGRHVLNLLLGFSARDSDLEFLVLYCDKRAIGMVERAGGPYRGRLQWIRCRSSVGSSFENIEIPLLLKLHRVDLLHDTSGSGLSSGGVPVLATVHELGAFHSSSGLSHAQTEQARERIRKNLKRARLVLSVSRSIAEELEVHLHLSRPMMRIIPNAVDPWYSTRVSPQEVRVMRERFGLEGPYFLCVSADKPSKNIDLIRHTAQKWDGPEQWVFTSAGKGDNKARYLDVVEDHWLRPLYAASSAVVVPSFYEGFSLPPLEALAVGALPVLSSIPAHREIFGQVLPEELFFDPKSQENLHEILRRVVDSRETSIRSVLEKFKLVRDGYSFIETAEQTQNVYREINK